MAQRALRNTRFRLQEKLIDPIYRVNILRRALIIQTLVILVDSHAFLKQMLRNIIIDYYEVFTN